ncbi:MAG: hypothetical protein CL916_06920, partial [Deltaproteobacteria bacterium]|nr:hypothetical protein [Deltaproteobacteria bacterium]
DSEVLFCEQDEEIYEETDLSDIILKHRIRLAFFGDIFWGRGVDVRARSRPEGYEFPFVHLSKFQKKTAETWIGNLECPITRTQESYSQMKKLLKFSCKPDYLSFARSYFDIFSLANNHTNNMEEVHGFEQTKSFLDTYKFQYFGTFDNARTTDICEVVSVNAHAIDGLGEIKEMALSSFPIALCGYHNVLGLPLQNEIDIISKYASHFFTIVMPHQGEEYLPRQNRWQEKVYRLMVDAGADVIVGGHTHSIQGVEWYKNKPIIYSLGNFIFDQQFGTTAYGIVYRMEIFVEGHDSWIHPDVWIDVADCNTFQDTCLENAVHLDLEKPRFSYSQDIVISHNKKMQPQPASASVSKQKMKEMGWETFIKNTPH